MGNAIEMTGRLSPSRMELAAGTRGADFTEKMDQLLTALTGARSGIRTASFIERESPR